MNLFDPVAVSLVLGSGLEPGLFDQPKHFDGTVAALLPKGRIEFLEELQGVKVPAEPKVESDPTEGLQSLWNPRNHGNVERPYLGRRDRRCHKGVRMKKLPQGG